MFVAEKGGTGAGRDRRRRAGREAADRHLRSREHERRPGAARRSRWTPASPRTTTSTCSTGYDAKTSASRQPKSSRLTRVTVNADNTASGETILLGSHPTQPCPAPANNVDCIAVGQQLPLDRDRPIGAGRHAVGRQRRRVELRRRGPEGAFARTTSRASAARSSTSTATATACRAIRSARPSRTSSRSAPRCGQRDSATRSGSRSGRTASRRSATWAGVHGRSSTSLQPGRNYGWPCYEGKLEGRRLLEPHHLQGLLLARRARRRGSPSPTTSTRHGAGSSIIGGPTYTGRPLPRRVRRRHHLRRLRAGVHQAARAGRHRASPPAPRTS